jgi:hypothetical protein
MCLHKSFVWLEKPHKLPGFTCWICYQHLLPNHKCTMYSERRLSTVKTSGTLNCALQSLFVFFVFFLFFCRLPSPSPKKSRYEELKCSTCKRQFAATFNQRPTIKLQSLLNTCHSKETQPFSFILSFISFVLHVTVRVSHSFLSLSHFFCLFSS